MATLRGSGRGSAQAVQVKWTVPCCANSRLASRLSPRCQSTALRRLLTTSTPPSPTALSRRAAPLPGARPAAPQGAGRTRGGRRRIVSGPWNRPWFRPAQAPQPPRAALGIDPQLCHGAAWRVEADEQRHQHAALPAHGAHKGHLLGHGELWHVGGTCRQPFYQSRRATALHRCLPGCRRAGIFGT